VSVKDEGLSPPRPARKRRTRAIDLERQRRVADIEFSLMDVRDALRLFQLRNDAAMYMEGLIEYARILGMWADLLPKGGREYKEG